MFPLIVFLVLLAFGAWLVFGATARQGNKCDSCRFARKVFDDGTLCGYGTKETFKNTVHVQNCVDYRGRRKGDRAASA